MILFLSKVNRLFKLMNCKYPMKSCVDPNLLFMDTFLLDLTDWERTAAGLENARDKDHVHKGKSSLPTKEVMYDMRLLMKGMKAFAKLYLPANNQVSGVTHALKQFVPANVLLYPKIQSSDACENFFSQARALGGGARNLVGEGVERTADNHAIRVMASISSTHVHGSNCDPTDETDETGAGGIGSGSVELVDSEGSNIETGDRSVGGSVGGGGVGRTTAKKKVRKTKSINAHGLTEQRKKYLALANPTSPTAKAPFFWDLRVEGEGGCV